MNELELIKQCVGFEWDKGNAEKNFIKHHVTPSESEQLFFNQPIVVASDPVHSYSESRYYVLGQTDSGRLLFASLTIRNRLIRVISVRPMSRQERRIYEKEHS